METAGSPMLSTHGEKDLLDEKSSIAAEWLAHEMQVGGGRSEDGRLRLVTKGLPRRSASTNLVP